MIRWVHSCVASGSLAVTQPGVGDVVGVLQLRTLFTATLVYGTRLCQLRSLSARCLEALSLSRPTFFRPPLAGLVGRDG